MWVVAVCGASSFTPLCEVRLLYIPEGIGKSAPGLPLRSTSLSRVSVDRSMVSISLFLRLSVSSITFALRLTALSRAYFDEPLQLRTRSFVLALTSSSLTPAVFTCSTSRSLRDVSVSGDVKLFEVAVNSFSDVKNCRPSAEVIAVSAVTTPASLSVAIILAVFATLSTVTVAAMALLRIYLPSVRVTMPSGRSPLSERYPRYSPKASSGIMKPSPGVSGVPEPPSETPSFVVS